MWQGYLETDCQKIELQTFPSKTNKQMLHCTYLTSFVFLNVSTRSHARLLAKIIHVVQGGFLTEYTCPLTKKGWRLGLLAAPEAHLKENADGN